MITRNFEITIRIPEQNYIPTLFQVVENDNDVYSLTIHITDGINEIDYSQVSSATITFALANGAVVQSDPERLTVSATGIIYQMGTSEIACPGKVLASIQLFGSSGERLTTARFRFEVVADLITPGAVQSESHFPLLQQLVADVEQLKQDIVDLQIPDNSVMDVKLSDAAGQIKQRFASHMADNVTDDGGIHGLEIESGTFTPSIAGTSTAGEGTYAYQIGKYYKIGKLVHIEIYLSWTAHTGTGNMGLFGLPFPVASSPGGHQVTFAISPYGITLSDGHIITGYSSSGNASITLRQYNSAGAFIPIPMDTEAQIRVIGSYLTN